MPHTETRPGTSESVETEKPEPWLNQEREGMYKQLIEEVKLANERGVTGGQYLAELVKNHAQDYGTKVRFANWFKPEDYNKVRFVLLNSASLNKVAGAMIERPIFVAEDEKTYQRLEAMFGRHEKRTHGVHFPTGFFDNKTIWEKVGLVITKDRETTAIHEIRHSADPFVAHGVEGREGYDNAVAELFAFYKEYVLDKEQPDWEGLKWIVTEGYYATYTSAVPEEQRLTQAEYSEKVRKAVGGLEKLRQKHGDVGVQRKLVQIKALDELIEVSTVR